MIEKDFHRVERGMVFWYSPQTAYHTDILIKDGKNTSRSHLQQNNRPWLVVSNKQNNLTAPTCQVVPITSEVKSKLPVNITFDLNGSTQTILCNHIQTVDTCVLRDYMYTVSDAVMARVEKALAIEFEIRPAAVLGEITSSNIAQQLSKTIDSLIQYKVQEYKEAIQNNIKVGKVNQEQIDNIALNLGQTLENLVLPVVTEELSKPEPKVENQAVSVQKNVQPEKPVQKLERPEKAYGAWVPVPDKVDNPEPVTLREPDPAEVPKTPRLENTQGEPKPVHIEPNNQHRSQMDKFNSRLQKTQQTQKAKVEFPKLEAAEPKNAPAPKHPADTEKRKYTRWTPEKCREYLADFETMTPDQIQEKWNIKSKSTVFTVKYRCRNLLGV